MYYRKSSNLIDSRPLFLGTRDQNEVAELTTEWGTNNPSHAILYESRIAYFAPDLLRRCLLDVLVEPHHCLTGNLEPRFFERGFLNPARTG